MYQNTKNPLTNPYKISIRNHQKIELTKLNKLFIPTIKKRFHTKYCNMFEYTVF